ncbi:MAG TPA: L-serine ammonia-lyase, iron-sulfur-dependent, subunit alpha, partial [Kiritimatiellia bacterium]|nr:L-serine ammonia-lyase, iron-sulfur-dependent, subunit alpha [Kiritimatiellia bacterium]HQQ05325.1 L-serine ammonia-lyase, iron-sulfur-dependent, subunit alpha [Kiritimatiellia bacterium]
MSRKIEELLRSEIVQVMGCTEPASVAFAFATARKYLQKPFDLRSFSARLTATSDILRNASTAVVPRLNKRGLRTVAAAGLSASAESFNIFPSMNLRLANKLLCRRGWLETRPLKQKEFFVRAELKQRGETVAVEITGRHDHIARVVRNGRTVCRAGPREDAELNMDEIWAIVKERNPALENIALDFITRQVRGSGARPPAARVPALVRARMLGAASPIMTITGSGNQGIFIGVPFCELYRKKGDAILPAVLFALLTQIHLTKRASRISGACGLATKAAPALTAGLMYAQGASLPEIRKAIEHLPRRIGYIPCPGAMASCGTKA